MTEGQFIFLVITFLITIFNFIFTIVSFKVDGETDQEYREKFSKIYENLVDYRLHKSKVEKVLKLEKDE